MTRRRRVVIFDLGGVVCESPIVSIRRCCIQRGVGDVNRFIGSSDSWSALERGQLTPEHFPTAMLKESETKRFADGVKLGEAGWAAIIEAVLSQQMRPTMVSAISRLRANGFTVVALTNNFIQPSDGRNDKEATMSDAAGLRDSFDHFIESRATGLRKPDPAIYQLTLEHAGCKAEDAVFLDDIGQNLKPAKTLGIHTIHVRNDNEYTHLHALKKLEGIVGLKLVDLAEIAKAKL